jgi:ETC complex I subunit conserved region
MLKVRIFQPARSVMQSGKARSGSWLLEALPQDRQQADPLMGWAGSSGTDRQIRLPFDSAEAALDFAKKKGWQAQVQAPAVRALKIQTYADNFK